LNSFAGYPERLLRPARHPLYGWRIVFISVLVAGAAILLFNEQRESGASTEAARTLAVNALIAGHLLLSLQQPFYRPAITESGGSLRQREGAVAAGVLVLLQLGFTYLGPLQDLFGRASLSARDWAWVILAGLAVFLLEEMEKPVMGRLRSTSRTERGGEGK
jgi:magnesium-transporting ATPase (P-type)